MNNPTIQIQKIKISEKDCVFGFTITTNDPLTKYEFLIDKANAQWMADNLARMIKERDKDE